MLIPSVSDHAYYAPLGAVIAVHPTVADSASAAWRTVLAILTGFALAVVVSELSRGVPDAVTIALIVALAIAVEQWRLWRGGGGGGGLSARPLLPPGGRRPARPAPPGPRGAPPRGAARGPGGARPF